MMSKDPDCTNQEFRDIMERFALKTGMLEAAGIVAVSYPNDPRR